MPLPHDARLAAENAANSLESEALKAAATGGPEAAKAAEAALAEGRLPLALVFARKASEKLEGAEARCLLGELLLLAGSPSAALATFQDAHKLAEGKDARAATGVAVATGQTGTDAHAAIEEAKKTITSPSLKYDLARLELLDGKLDEAAEAVQFAQKLGAKRLKPGDTQLTNLGLLQAEVELAGYAEAAWPRRGTRAERKAEADKPADKEVAAWRLERAAEALKVSCRLPFLQLPRPKQIARR